ncbi:putative inorganic carbon transporter subunit DabA, partial [Marinomonas sp.]|uniref:putative inorganic carbon transporter subunit DabA n=1 Tax=Marinomonas sp. TaxID=1904862 RepID=UPI003C711B2C
MTMNNQQKSLLVTATKKIAPSWPLDKLIAVNPLWSLIDKPFDTVAAELSAIAGIKAHLPIETYVAWFKQGRIDQASLTKAAQHYSVDALPELLIEMMSQPTPTLT